MTGNREYLDIDAAWSRLDAGVQAAIGALALKIAVCRARRTHADPKGPDANAAGVAETLPYDQLYDVTRRALPDLVTSRAAVRLLTLPGLIRHPCPRGGGEAPCTRVACGSPPSCAKCQARAGDPGGRDRP